MIAPVAFRDQPFDMVGGGALDVGAEFWEKQIPNVIGVHWVR